MGYSLTTLSTPAVPGNSSPLSVSWRSGKPWSALLTISSSAGTGDFTIQYTLQDLTSTGIPTSTSQGLPGPTWVPLTAANGAAGLSSAQASSNGYVALHFTVPNIDPAAGMLVWGSYPIAGIRIASTAMSSNTLTLALVQGDGW